MLTVSCYPTTHVRSLDRLGDKAAVPVAREADGSFSRPRFDRVGKRSTMNLRMDCSFETVVRLTPWLPGVGVGGPMKVYLRVTGTVFALITLAHGLRMYLEGSRVIRDPVFVLLTILTAALTAWAWRLHRTLTRSEPS